MSEDNLPPNWYSAKAEDGTVYYYHGVTNETQWEKPEWPSKGGETNGAPAGSGGSSSLG